MESALSPIETLPDELIFAIIDLVPEYVHSLRLASKTMRVRVDDYIAQAKDLVYRLIVSSGEDGALALSMEILPEVANQFELRLKQSCARNSCARDRVRRDEPNGGSLVLVHRARYHATEDTTLLRSVRDCLGRLAIVVIADSVFEEEVHRASISTLLAGVLIDTVQFTTASLTNVQVEYLQRLVVEHKADSLYLRVDENATEDPVRMLLEFSSLVRCIALTQMHVQGIDHNERYLLGKRDFGWAPTIIEMFSNERKLDKLCVSNAPYLHFLSDTSFETLCEILPKLGKKVWFESYRNMTLNDHVNKKIGEHYVKVGYRSASIKHVSRVQEPLMGRY